MKDLDDAAPIAADMPRLQKQHEALVAEALERAAKQGATGAAASISTGNGLTVSVRMGEVEKIEHENDKAIDITVYMGAQKGNASSSDLTAGALEASVDAACAIARHANRDEHAGLAAPELMAKECPDLDLHHPWECSPQEAAELCAECERQAMGQDHRIDNSDGAVLSTWSGLYVYGNSHGFMGGWPSSGHSLSCAVIARDAQGNMQRDGWHSCAADRHDMETAQAIGTQAGQRCVNRLGAKKLTTRQAPVLFEAPVASGLFADFVGAVSGASQYRRASFLLDKKGQAVFPEHLCISEQPQLPKGEGSAPFDTDGIATRSRELVRCGVLQDYVLSAYSARRLGLTPTGNGGGVRNLTIHPGTAELPALLGEMDTGLLVTDLIGFGTNLLTGDYSRGAAGFWVEQGELHHPVEEITVAGNLREVYQRILAAGRDVDRRGNILTGSILVENMTVAGN